MLFKELHTYKRHYGILIFGLALLLSLFLIQPNAFMRMGLAVGLGVWYTAWGILSHQSKFRTDRLVLEYALMGTIGALILISIVNNI